MARFTKTILFRLIRVVPAFQVFQPPEFEVASDTESWLKATISFTLNCNELFYFR